MDNCCRRLEGMFCLAMLASLNSDDVKKVLDKFVFIRENPKVFDDIINIRLEDKKKREELLSEKEFVKKEFSDKTMEITVKDVIEESQQINIFYKVIDAVKCANVNAIVRKFDGTFWEHNKGY